MSEAIEYGKRYPLHLSKNNADLITLQFNFKPRITENCEIGSVRVDNKSNEAFVALNSIDGKVSENFKGDVILRNDDLAYERVLNFNGDSFSISKSVSEIHHLKHVRHEENLSFKSNASSEIQGLNNKSKLAAKTKASKRRLSSIVNEK